MAVKKLNVGDIPKEKLEELKPLLQAEGVLVPIGKSIYELYPTPAVKLLKVLGDAISLVKTAKERKIEKLKELGTKDIDPSKVHISTDEILADSELVDRIKALLWEILEGVDKEDFENITTGQLINLLQKVLEVNLNTLPPEFKQTVLATYQKKLIEPVSEVSTKGNLKIPSSPSSGSQLN